MPDAEFMTKAEAAQLMRLSRATIDRLRASGQLPFVKLGKKVIFRRSDIDAFLERHYHPMKKK
jgi:excisionase family DNA binding protein